MTKIKETYSILDRETTLEGTISFKGTLMVRGDFKGTLVGETLIIEKEGAVCADIKVGSVTIGGAFEGNIRALTELTILSTGRCEGKVTCQNLVIEPGGFLNGEVKRISTDRQTAVA